MFDQTFLSIELFSDIAKEFDWPAPYFLDDELPDGISMNFPKASLFFTEEFGAEIEVQFDSEELGLKEKLELIDAFMILIPNFDSLENPFGDLPLTNDPAIEGSQEKLKNNLRDAFLLVNTYLKEFMQGDLTWVTQYKERNA